MVSLASSLYLAPSILDVNLADAILSHPLPSIVSSNRELATQWVWKDPRKGRVLLLEEWKG